VRRMTDTTEHVESIKLRAYASLCSAQPPIFKLSFFCSCTSITPHSSNQLFAQPPSLYHNMPAKKRCQLQGDQPCNSAVLRIVGHCPHCRSDFCANVCLFRLAVSAIDILTLFQHRLPEHHMCTNMEDCRQQAFNKNKAKLESERTVASKMAMT
jgi:predicted nucleic acid binding AN1-type Zn finger protein